MNQSRRIDNLIVYAFSVTIISLTINTLQSMLLNIFLILNNIIVLIFEVKANGLIIKKKDANMFVIILSIIMVVLIISIFGINLEKSLKTVIIYLGQVILLFLIFLFDYNKINNFCKFIKIFNIFITICILYALLIKLFGGIPQPYISGNGVSIYKQSLDIGGIHLSQITMGENIKNQSVSSLTGNPNTFSYLCMYAAAINISMINLNKHNKRRIKGYYLLLLLSIFGIFLGGSRTAFIIMGLYLLIYDYISIKSNGENYIKKRQVIICILAIILIGIIILMNKNQDIMKELLDLNGRELVWNIFFKTFENNPLFIAGLGNSTEVVAQSLGYELSMHNTYFTIITELGLFVGTFLIILNFVYVLGSLKKIAYYKGNTLYKELLRLSIGISICILIKGLTEVVIITNNMESYLYFYLIFIQMALRGRREDDEV